MGNGRRTVARKASLALLGLALAAGILVPGSPADAGTATLQRPDGAGPPVKASGMGTQAALDNPRCRHDEPEYGPYGRFDSTSVGGGPACVKAWEDGDDNGGATWQGVTEDRIKVVAYVPNEEQAKTDPVPPKVRPGNTNGTHRTGSTTTSSRGCGSTRRGAATSRCTSSPRPAATSRRSVPTQWRSRR